MQNIRRKVWSGKTETSSQFPLSILWDTLAITQPVLWPGEKQMALQWKHGVSTLVLWAIFCTISCTISCIFYKYVCHNTCSIGFVLAFTGIFPNLSFPQLYKDTPIEALLGSSHDSLELKNVLFHLTSQVICQDN